MDERGKFTQRCERAQEDYSKEYNVAKGNVLFTEKYFDTTIKQGEFFPTVKVTRKENRLATSPSSFTGKKQQKIIRVSSIAALQASTSGHYSSLNRLKTRSKNTRSLQAKFLQ